MATGLFEHLTDAVVSPRVFNAVVLSIPRHTHSSMSSTGYFISCREVILRLLEKEI